MTASRNKDARVFSQLVEALKVRMESYGGAPFGIRMWIQAYWQSGQSPRFVLVLNTPHALYALVSDPTQLSLGVEEFVEGGLEIEGDLFAALYFAEFAFNSIEVNEIRLGARLALALLRSWDQATHLRSLVRRHTRDRDRRATSYHYDQPSEFFMPWLGESMAYSCAYSERGDETLDEAQENKLEYICRKLRLRPGDRLLDIGCGCGNLILHAAKYHGASCTGITLSEQQARSARKRIAEQGFKHKCIVKLCDYRELVPGNGQFDKIASVGMVEHVGKRNLGIYFNATKRLLKPGGVILNHGIVESVEENRLQGPSFIRKYVFPDSDLVTLATTINKAEQAGFEVRDVENLREHYNRTLHKWVDQIQAHEVEVIKYVNERSHRIWRLYMAGSAHAFRNGRIAIHHVLLMKGRWRYLYRAIDSCGATIDFLLSALGDAEAAKRLFLKALSDPSHPQPRVINTDQAPIYGSAIPYKTRFEKVR